MDRKFDEIFSSLRHKIKTIVSMYEEQKNANLELQTENRNLNEKLAELENNLEETEKNFDNFKMAKVLSTVSEGDIHDTKLQVNRIVREIDKCIALLNR
ncbi:MAG: hypothetical protein JXB19_06500 [Bacteroidales bacterium]|nr:hypothetical protein [Bacteroidales bacterium]